ncbi:MAG: hypothetical protein ACI9YR_002393, partial [Bacteroidia bacterium]
LATPSQFRSGPRPEAGGFDSARIDGVCLVNDFEKQGLVSL